MNSIVAQDEQDVKLSPADLGLEECGVEWCHEPVFRRGLCWDHFVKEETALWEDDRQTKRAILESIGI